MAECGRMPVRDEKPARDAMTGQFAAMQTVSERRTRRERALPAPQTVILFPAAASRRPSSLISDPTAVSFPCTRRLRFASPSTGNQAKRQVRSPFRRATPKRHCRGNDRIERDSQRGEPAAGPNGVAVTRHPADPPPSACPTSELGRRGFGLRASEPFQAEEMAGWKGSLAGVPVLIAVLHAGLSAGVGRPRDRGGEVGADP